MAYIANSTTETVIYAQLSGIDTTGWTGDGQVYWYIDGSFEGTTDALSSSSNSGTFTFSGLSPGTTYLIEATLYYPTISGTQNSDYSSNVTTDEEVLPQLPTPSVTSTSTTSNSIYINIDYISGADNYYADVLTNADGFIKTVSNTSSSVNITGLDPSTEYIIYLYVTGSGYEDSNLNRVDITTDSMPKLSIPSITSVSSTTSSITMDMGSVTGADRYYLEAWEGAILKGSNSSTSSSVTVSGLQPNRYFELRRWVTGSGYEDSNIGYSNAYTDDLGTLATPTITNLASSETAITVNIDSVANATDYYYRVELMDGSLVDSTVTSALQTGFIGLTPDTEYRVQVQARNTNYTNSDYATDYIYTNPEVLVAPTNFSLSSVLEGGATWTWDAVTGADNYVLRAVRIYDGNTITKTGPTTSITFTSGSLQYGVNYDFSVKAIRDEGAAYDSPWTTAISQITRPKKPTISIQSSTTNSITVEVTGMVDNYDGAWVNIYADGETNASNFLNDIWVSSNGGTATFTGLTMGTNYGFRGITYFTSGSVYKSDYTNILTGSTSSRPLNFAGWSTNVSSGADYSILASDWNAFTSKINEFEVYSGNAQTSFTTVSSGNDFLASYFTAARNAIAAMAYTGTLPSTKSSGDDVNAVDLNNIVDCLNSV